MGIFFSNERTKENERIVFKTPLKVFFGIDIVLYSATSHSYEVQSKRLEAGPVGRNYKKKMPPICFKVVILCSKICFDWKTCSGHLQVCNRCTHWILTTVSKKALQVKFHCGKSGRACREPQPLNRADDEYWSWLISVLMCFLCAADCSFF